MNKVQVLFEIEQYQKNPKVLTSPLRFSRYYGHGDISLDGLTIEKMVLEVLKAAEFCISRNRNGLEETRNGARRSALDIWRHIILFKPEITLPEVMQAMYNIRRKLDSNYCGTVKRRVFSIRKPNPWAEPGERYLYFDDSRHYDEYGLQFKNWNIKGLEE